MFRLIKQVYIVLMSFKRSLASIVNTPDHTKGIALNNQQYMTQPTLNYLYPNEYTQELRSIHFQLI